MNVDINPKILIWAREERGMTIEDAANKLKIESSDLQQWEIDGKNILFGSIELIAKLYKRQTAAFFLPDVPVKIKKPKDCRNLAVNESSFSTETMFAIRRTDRYLQTARELLEVNYWNNQYKWLENFSGKKIHAVEEVAMLRDLLETEETNKKNQRSDAAFRNWRTVIEENLGIFVFQFSMPENELDGFSYAFDEFPFAIVVNNKSKPVRKIFTLFHELFHILKRNSGVCKPDFATNQLAIEFECNSAAGKFLVPEKYLKNCDSAEEIFKLAKPFNISGEVYLRRLLDENMISKNEFFKMLEAVREKSNSFPRKKPKGAPSRIIQSKSTRGNKFYNIVIGAATTSKISYSTASDLLGLKVGNIRL